MCFIFSFSNVPTTLCAFYDEHTCVCAETHCYREIGTERAAVLALVTQSQSVHLLVIPLCLSQRWMSSSFHSKFNKEKADPPRGESVLINSTQSFSVSLSLSLCGNNDTQVHSILKCVTEISDVQFFHYHIDGDNITCKLAMTKVR